MLMFKCTKCMKDLDEGTRICPYCGYDQEAEPQPAYALKRNTILRGKYLVGNVIGQGGFGITYVGFDLALEVKVAIKEYYPTGMAARSGNISSVVRWDYWYSTGKRNDGLERFLKEARRMAKLDSIPSVVRVRDAFAENDTAYIIMDYVEGVSLKSYLIENGVMKWEDCHELLLPVMESLEIIHGNGFIHRDISPDNIMIRPDGKAVLLDFGAAVDMSAHEGQASSAVVKHHFSAPEQYVESAVLGPWTDVYAMAATIYYCLTGKAVPDATERSFGKVPIEFPEAIEIPDCVKSALLHALELDENARTRDIRKLEQSLSGVREDVPESGPKEDDSGNNNKSAGSSGKKPKRKRIWWRTLLAVIVIAIIVVIAVVEVKLNIIYKDVDADGDVVSFKYNFITEEQTIVGYEDNGDGIATAWSCNLKAKVFSGRTDITGVRIPYENGSLIENGAFRDCSNLQWVVLYYDDFEIPNHCFDGCDSLRYLLTYGPLLTYGEVSYTGDIPSNVVIFEIEEYVDEAWMQGWDAYNLTFCLDEYDALYMLASKATTGESGAILIYVPDDVADYEVPEEVNGYSVVYVCDGVLN